MSAHERSRGDAARQDADAVDNAAAIAPLPGEPGIPDVSQQARTPLSRKGLFAVGLVAVVLAVGAGLTIHHLAGSFKKADDESKRAGDQPTAASTEPRRIELPPARGAAAASAPRIPALIATREEIAEPIGVRRTGQPAPATTKAMVPEDAPVLLVTTRPGTASRPATGRPVTDRHVEPPTADRGTEPADPLDETRRNLEGYQRQLQGMLDTLTRSTAAATSSPSAAPSIGTPTALGLPAITGAYAPLPSAGLFGGQMQRSATPHAMAGTLGNRSLTLPKGTAFTCALKTKVISATSGLVGCQVQRNVYSDDGRVLLIERGSHMDGEYRITSVRPGMVRIPVLWTRIRTPHGVTVDIDSPATGQLGESGIDGYVDNRWPERIGAALLLSVIDDAVKLTIQNQAAERTDTIILPSTTASTSKLAEKVLDSTINIPPLIFRNQGEIVGIYVARDVDFSSVYELQPMSGEAAR